MKSKYGILLQLFEYFNASTFIPVTEKKYSYYKQHMKATKIISGRKDNVTDITRTWVKTGEDHLNFKEKLLEITALKKN